MYPKMHVYCDSKSSHISDEAGQDVSTPHSSLSTQGSCFIPTVLVLSVGLGWAGLGWAALGIPSLGHWAVLGISSLGHFTLGCLLLFSLSVLHLISLGLSGHCGRRATFLYTPAQASQVESHLVLP